MKRFWKRQPLPQQHPLYASARVFVLEGMDAQLIYSALEDSLEKFDHDKRTKCDGAPNYCTEDEIFLTDSIDRVHRLLLELKYHHRNIVTKG